jgi:hypothetical protein
MIIGAVAAGQQLKSGMSTRKNLAQTMSGINALDDLFFELQEEKNVRRPPPPHPHPPPGIRQGRYR